MKSFFPVCIGILLLVVGGCGHPSNPMDARIVTTDLERFREAFTVFSQTGNPDVLQERYLDGGSVGLEGFMDHRIVGAEELGRTIRDQMDYYQSIQEPLMYLTGQEEQIRSVFIELQALYPEAVFPDVYFVVGRMNAGGTTSRHGLIIGAEMYGLTDAYPRDSLSAWHRAVLRPPSAVPTIVAHELIHFQQPFSLRSKLSPSLLYQALREGSADFVGELIAGDHINAAAHAYANPREEELWQEFRSVMWENDLSDWIANGGRSGDRPADLGYWMGYKIVEWYYLNAADKQQALSDIITMTDARAFLEMSGYADKWNR